jgi:hypothetical protein
VIASAYSESPPRALLRAGTSLLDCQKTGSRAHVRRWLREQDSNLRSGLQKPASFR